MTFDEACEVLGIEAGTDYVTAHRAYRTRARESHPDTASPQDRAAAADEMARINAAWRLLRDELQAPALIPGDEVPWPEQLEPEEPTTEPRRRPSRRATLLAAAGVVAVLGVGLSVTQIGGSSVAPDDYLGACLDAEGEVVDCDGSTADVEVVEQVSTGDDCDGPVFSDADGSTFYCTRALGA